MTPINEASKEAFVVGRNRAKVLLGSKKKEVLELNGFQVIIDVKGDRAFVIIRGGGNFHTNPRMLGNNDGYAYVDNAFASVGSGSLQYPLSTDGNTTINVTIDEDAGVTLDRMLHVYGNVDWKGPENLVLTWYGPPGRLVPYDTKLNISGLCVPDIKFDELAEDVFTCFGPNIFERGSILTTVPTTGNVEPKVLGCAYQNTEDASYLVAIVNNHYPDRIGFFEEVWIKKDSDWLKLHERSTGRPTSIWAFNQSGTQATQGVAMYYINASDGSVLYDAGENTSITATWVKNSDGSSHSVNYTGSTNVWSDFKEDTRVFVVVGASGGRAFTSNNSENSTQVEAPEYLLGTKATSVIVIVDSTGQATATPVGGNYCQCTGEWSISSGTISSTGKVNLASSCGTGIVTFKCADLVGTAEVRFTSGIWSLVSTCNAGDPSCWGTFNNELITGGTKIREQVYDNTGSCTNRLEYVTVKSWQSPNCVNYEISTVMWWDPDLNCDGTCGAPMSGYIQQNNVPYYGTATYIDCSDIDNKVARTVATTCLPAFGTMRREIYNWVCP